MFTTSRLLTLLILASLLFIRPAPAADDEKKIEKARLAAMKLNESGLEHLKNGKTAEGTNLFLRAETALVALVKEYPARAALQESLALVMANRGVALLIVGKLVEAEKSFQQAIALNERLLKSDVPARGPAHTRSLALVLVKLGQVQQSSGKKTESLKTFQRARDLQEKLVKQAPKEKAYRQDLAQTLTALARVLAAQGKKEEAAKALKQAKELEGKK